ncbi:MAG: hypothetical protein RMI89_04080 [Gloeomargarita sp. SKYBB_i_bin120]|nr:hypothetical protein [Gloeomargarita sp. SKYG98]MCS7292136.1 hypothetical protein [Gloeomargarita sp. SKYB120]MDW8177697.1 hypothetical protein [Gloeomargarita sp. SKYBB_i_bin120]
MTVLDLVLIGATLVLLWVVLRWFMQVTFSTLKTLAIVGLVLLVLQFGFGIGPRLFIERVWELGQRWLNPP